MFIDSDEASTVTTQLEPKLRNRQPPKSLVQCLALTYPPARHKPERLGGPVLSKPKQNPARSITHDKIDRNKWRGVDNNLENLVA